MRRVGGGDSSRPDVVTAPRDHAPMPHRYDQSDLGPDAQVAHRQAIRNRRPIPPRHLQRDHAAKVTVRIDWEHDGVEWIDADTIAYCGDDVLAVIHDRRMGRVIGVWVASADVRRR